MGTLGYGETPEVEATETVAEVTEECDCRDCECDCEKRAEE